ncbi:MAG: oligosaccharide flippase family protein [Bacteroidales bacterium]|nr:oligosaccharide flippase family protein [Bacteroidales bacterium]
MFLLLPLYTHILQPADYGKLELVYLIGNILIVFYSLSIENGYNRIYFHDKDTGFRKVLFSTGQLFSFLSAIAIASIMLFNADYIAGQFLNFDEGTFFLKLIAAVIVIEVLTHIPLNNIRIRNEAKTFVLINLLSLIIVTSFTIYFLVFARLGIAGILYARIISGLVTLSILLYLTRREYKFGFSSSQLKLMLGFSIFLIPVNLSSLILNMSNRYFLQEYQSLEDVGLYSLGAKIAGIIPFLFNEPVNKAFFPYLFEQIDEPQKCKKILVDFSMIYVSILSAIALFISLFAREVVMVMADKSYEGSHSIVAILSLSYILLGFSSLTVLGIHISRKTWIVSIIWPVSAIVNIALNILLIPEFGQMGAAIATLLSVIVINILYLFALSKVYPVSFNYSKLSFIFITMVILNYIGTLINYSLTTSIILKSLLFITFLLILYIGGAFRTDEFSLSKHLKKKKNDNG